MSLRTHVRRFCCCSDIQNTWRDCEALFLCIYSEDLWHYLTPKVLFIENCSPPKAAETLTSIVVCLLMVSNVV